MTSKGGFIETIIIIVILIIALGYFGVSIRSVVESEMIKDNFSYVWGFLKDIWNNYLRDIAGYIWNILYSLIRPILK